MTTEQERRNRRYNESVKIMQNAFKDNIEGLKRLAIRYPISIYASAYSESMKTGV